MDRTAQIVAPPQVATKEQERRRERLTAIIENGLPPFPHTVIELTAVLSKSYADIKKAAKLIRTDPSMSAQVLRMCNSPLFGLRSRVLGIEQAAVLLGSDRLRTLALTSSLVDFAGHGLPKEQVMAFWRHSFFAAMLSQHLAKRREYSESEQAYIAGLLHDIGHVPHWMLAAEEKMKKKPAPPENWFDNIVVEREHFGMDHCEVGSRIATSWNFMPSFIDVLVSHHEPEHADHDPHLVKIVAAVEHYLLTKPEDPTAADGAPSADQGRVESPDQDRVLSPQFARITGQPFDESEWPYIVESLDEEYKRLIPLVQSGLQSIIRPN